MANKKTKTSKPKKPVKKTIAKNRASNKKADKPVRLPYAWVLVKQSLSLLKNNWKIFLGILLAYVLLVLITRGFSLSSDFSSVKESVDQLLGEGAGKVGSTIGLYAYAVASSGSNASGQGGAHQLFITIIVSLAAIWAARQLMAGEKIRIRDTFYLGMYPLIPFLLVFLVMCLQLIPALIGSFLFGTVWESGIAVTFIEKFLWVLFLLSLLALSLYMLCSSIFALYISTLPGMTPMRALRSARGLVRRRRISVALRIITLPLFLLLLSMLVVIPLILIASWSVEWAVLVLGGFSLIFTHSYFYMLYRSLL
jgi:hypothetical protein